MTINKLLTLKPGDKVRVIRPDMIDCGRIVVVLKAATHSRIMNFPNGRIEPYITDDNIWFFANEIEQVE